MREPRTPPAKARDRKKVVLRLGGYLLSHRRMALGALFLSIGGNMLSLVGPLLSGRAIDAIGLDAGQADFSLVFFYCALMLVFYALSALCAYFLSVLMIRLSQKIIFSMREDLFKKLTELPVRFFDAHQAGDIVSRMSYDIDTVNASLSNDLIQIFASTITVLGSLFMMLALSPPLVLVFSVTIPACIILSRYMAKKVRPLFGKRSQEWGNLGGFVEETISAQKTVKAYHREQTMIERFCAYNTAAVDSSFRAEYYGSMAGPSVKFINNLSLSLVSTLGALLFLGGRLSLGYLSSFVLYSRKFSGPINEIANIAAELQSALAAAERVFSLMDEPSEPPDAQQAQTLLDVCGAVDFSNVTFGYSKERTTLKNISLSAQPDQLIALVGPTGSGKTTLINLLMRFYDPDSGQILLDGTPTLSLTRKSLRLAFAMVLQDAWLFSGTIYQNIAYGKPDATQAEVERAAKAACIHRYITSLPNGYQTLVSENGMSISQGQKQLLTIARAMLIDANMLILDEATSNVDTRTEMGIQKAMRTLMQNKTCFVIAHRLSTIQNADKILVVQAGEIIGQGTHEQLMQAGGLYAELYHAQFL